jgi:5-carboxymethyl-2-hydroxymuconate isomerase
MPHFIIECSSTILQRQSPGTIMQTVYDTAAATGLFAVSGAGGIKVRIAPYEHYITVNSKENFIHVFAYIMEGRNTAQKQDLSKKITAALNKLLPWVAVISINISDFEKATYCNKTMLQEGS